MKIEKTHSFKGKLCNYILFVTELGDVGVLIAPSW